MGTKLRLVGFPVLQNFCKAKLGRAAAHRRASDFEDAGADLGTSLMGPERALFPGGLNRVVGKQLAIAVFCFVLLGAMVGVAHIAVYAPERGGLAVDQLVGKTTEQPR